MNLLRRVENTLKSGGIKELVRKSFYHFLYVYNGKEIVKEVKKSDCEFGIRKIPNVPEVIVSLTSYPQRFYGLELCLKSLVLQSVKPDKIIVYLGSDSIGADLPECVQKYERFGIEFRRNNEENLKSFKKFYYANNKY